MERIFILPVKTWTFFLFIIILNYCSTIDAAFCKFSNLRCHSFNKSLMEYKTCRIRAVGRDDNYLHIHAILKEPARAGIVNIRLLKRANGWKPFLYNITFDACKFMRNPNANPVGQFFYNVIHEYTNLNHSCPYEKEIIMDKFRITEQKVKLPFPIGEYAVDTVWHVNGKLLTQVNGSCVGDYEF